MVCTHAITDRHAQTTAQDSAETHSTRRQEAVGYNKNLLVVNTKFHEIWHCVIGGFVDPFTIFSRRYRRALCYLVVTDQ